MSSDGNSASTTEIVPVYRVLPERVEGGGAVLVLSSGAFRMILEASSVSFDMKSEDEQEAIIYSYGAMLASLGPDFPIQIWCHTTRLNPERYLGQFDGRLANPQTSPQMRRLIEDHRRHFAEQVMSQNLLERRFFITLPYMGTPGPAQDKLTDQLPLTGLLRVFTARSEQGRRSPRIDQRDIDIARQQLDLRAHHVTEQLARMGIASNRLGEVEVVRLLNAICHPGLAESRPIMTLPAGADLVGSLGETSSDLRRRAQRTNEEWA